MNRTFLFDLLLPTLVGYTFISSGWKKIVSKQKKWTRLGLKMGNIGIYFLPIFWGLAVFHSVHTTENYPVDVCFLIADLKYNSKQGVKICEIQEASLSLFHGDEFQNLPEEKSIYNEFLRVLSLYNKNGWVVTNCMTDKKVASTLASSPSWQNPIDMVTLLNDPYFIYKTKQPVANIHDLSSYQGFLYLNWFHLYPAYEKAFSGMIVIDRSSFPFWTDKYQVTRLFVEDEVLSTFKPRCGHYKKNYTKELAAQVANDLQCDIFVIKPRGEFLGRGVIIIDRQNLDEVLFFITTQSGRLAQSNDPSFSAWKVDPFDSFIVEEFVTSDPIVVPHLDNKTYQPTMRVPFVLVYDKGCHYVHFLGGYWKTPAVALNEIGDFMQKNKDICKPPYYCAVDPKTMQLVQDELRIALPLLHSKMLQFKPDLQQKAYEQVENIHKKVHAFIMDPLSWRV